MQINGSRSKGKQESILTEEKNTAYRAENLGAIVQKYLRLHA